MCMHVHLARGCTHAGTHGPRCTRVHALPARVHAHRSGGTRGGARALGVPVWLQIGRRDVCVCVSTGPCCSGNLEVVQRSLPFLPPAPPAPLAHRTRLTRPRMRALLRAAPARPLALHMAVHVHRAPPWHAYGACSKTRTCPHEQTQPTCFLALGGPHHHCCEP